MPVVVSVRDVVNEMDAITDEATAYLNRKTGELYTVTDEEVHLVEDEDDPEELPAWQRETLPKVRDVLDSEDWLALPTKFDIHEYAIMDEFCRSIDDLQLREELLNAIRGQGAFRYFKDTIHRHGVQDEWYRYREGALEKIAIEWLEEHEIAYERERKRSQPNSKTSRDRTMAQSVPKGWQSVTPRIVVPDVEKLIKFLKHTFGAIGEFRMAMPSVIRIGDSLIMLSGTELRDPMPAFLYVYVDDVDSTYKRALEAGAISLEEPQDMPYGDRRGMVRDAWGNIWQIATHKEDLSIEEIRRRTRNESNDADNST